LNALGSVLLWITDHGYQFLLVGLVLAFLVRDPQTRRTVVRVFLILGGIVVGCVFIAAAYGKMKPPEGFPWSWSSARISLSWFAIQVDSYHILSPTLANAVAHFLPYFELCLGLWLLSCIGQRFSGLLASLTLIVFIIAITSAYLRGLKIDCGCGIGPPEEVGPAAIARDALKFLLPALLVTFGAFWLRRHPRAVEESASPATASASAG
jgi:hypothetical protein